MRGIKGLLKLTFVASIAIAMSGCSTLGLQNAKMPAQPVAGQSFQVVMHDSFGKPKTFTGAVSDELTVQQALKQSGALGRYKNMSIDVMRPIEGRRVGVKMPVDYKPSSKTVRVEQDYAVHAGDKIVVKPKKEGLDKVVRNLFGT